MLAKDIMTCEVMTVKPEDDIEKAVKLILENKISGLPVVDDDRNIVGIISEKDLIIKAGDLELPFYITLFDSIIFLDNPIRFNNNLKKYSAVQVKEAMTDKVYTVEEDTPISDVVELMQKHRINRVPVAKEGKLVGIISRNDILKAVVKRNG